jgi:hypothetical protein
MAEILGIYRKTLSKIINEKGSVTPDMALRLSRAFDTTSDFWLNLQKNFDLWNAYHAGSHRFALQLAGGGQSARGQGFLQLEGGPDRSAGSSPHAEDEWNRLRDAGEPVWTLDALKEALATHFCMLGDPRDVPFVIRETRRKFQHSVAELTAWELKG